MSASILRLIPIIPTFVPDIVTQERAKTLLSTFVSQTSRILVTDEVQFIDQGGNFERILCPFCKRELNIRWWQKAMNIAFEFQFANLTITLPCCNLASTLNDLHYEWPAGFARFTLETTNPTTDLSQEQIRHLEHTLGCKLRKIWAHY